MTRRANGKRYLGNTNTKEVHDLDNEQPQCQISKIIVAGHDVYFDAHAQAKAAGYDNGHWCLGNSTR
ncbi:hypothetical protein [Candidatus Nitrosotenuis uzonensis]|uniref:Uncharacterized protein n=1 Tax=Candidatus Nitrosotenuis uzonensis TaxID=1407055 RepID=A0A812F1Z7_9ARCH|nr:hypothetical protein [Candidatus Nitrosotenuis uzonensis]CAE6488997.1 conserved hypothetical protein [Candidatus Nitrosotenuis uzonensis]